MILIAFDFLSIVVYAFFASVLFIAYRLTWRLAYLSEWLIVSLARAGLYSMARGLLFGLIGYNEHTYQQSRFVVRNQVHVRFFVLWGVTFLFTGLIFLFRIPPVVWVPAALGFTIYRSISLWMNPPMPPISTQDLALKQLIQDVNEPLRPTPKPARPLIRRWDYLDELFAESA